MADGRSDGKQKWKRKRSQRKWVEAMKAAKEAKLTASTPVPVTPSVIVESRESEEETPLNSES